jgi:hypothetical protein
MIELIAMIAGGLMLFIGGLISILRKPKQLTSRIEIRHHKQNLDAEFEAIKEQHEKVYQPDNDMSLDVSDTIARIRRDRDKSKRK